MNRLLYIHSYYLVSLPVEADSCIIVHFPFLTIDSRLIDFLSRLDFIAEDDTLVGTEELEYGQ
jgi:hypothetical protein